MYYKQKLEAAEKLPEPTGIREALTLVLQAVEAELNEWESAHYHEEFYAPLPVVELMLNASNRLPAGLREIYLSAEWPHSGRVSQREQLDENLWPTMPKRTS